MMAQLCARFEETFYFTVCGPCVAQLRSDVLLFGLVISIIVHFVYLVVYAAVRYAHILCLRSAPHYCNSVRTARAKD